MSHWKTVLDSCLRQIRVWHTPRNYSASDWMEEMRAHGAAAAWQAERDYDPARGVPLAAFVRQRVMADAFTRYRQEWTYATRCIPDEDQEALRIRAQEGLAGTWIQDAQRCALAQLSASGEWLIEQLFCDRRTESDMAKVLGISQQAVSKRKHAILGELRHSLGFSGGKQSSAVVNRAAACVRKA